MKTPKLLVTGSSGLVGSAVVDLFGGLGWEIHGLDNNMRAEYFGAEADTRGNQRRLSAVHARFQHHEVDIRARVVVGEIVRGLRPDLVVHAAAQPSHELAARRPFLDFDVNAGGTLNLIEAVRRHAPEAVFVLMSTNKVYGDGPNRIRLVERPTRWDYDDPAFADGIAENFPIDQTTRSLFGASKTAADVMTQEYGRYFGMKTCCLRAGCVTGPRHCGVELHGFLSHLIKCNAVGRHYTVFGHSGKQVRDNIHAEDVARFILAFHQNPRCGQVYNIGGGGPNSISILEAFERATEFSGRAMNHEYEGKSRAGDHICYISNLSKIKGDYPGWSVTKTLDDIFGEIYAACVLSGADFPSSTVAAAHQS